jgi:type IV secretion system protein VirB10
MAENNSDSPPEGEGYEYKSGNDDGSKNGGGLSSGAPAVAAAPGKMMLILVAAALGIGFVVYSLFSPEEEAPKKVEKKPEQVVSPRDDTVPIPIPIPIEPQLPDKEPVKVEPEPVKMEPPPPPPIPELDVKASGANNEVLQARIRSEMMVLKGTSKVAADPKKDAAQNALSANDPNSAFASNVSRSSEAEVVEAANMGNLRFMIAQGKIIHAVLETAINSDLPGNIRAIVSRDIFAEAGSIVLIPKGSRLIGVYNSSILRGQKRAFIVWNRVIRPDGIDVMVDSPGIDSLGRAGFEGYVHSKIMEAYTGAILSSLVSFGVAYAGEKAIGEESAQSTTTTTNSSLGSTTSTTSTPSADALKDLTANVGAVTTSVVDDMLDLRPTITVDQGTRINVFVNKDLVFPPSVLAKTKIIQ